MMHVLQDWGKLSVHSGPLQLTVKSGATPLGKCLMHFPEIPGNTRGLLWAAQENSETPLSCLWQVAFPGVNFLLTDPQQLGLISG